MKKIPPFSEKESALQSKHNKYEVLTEEMRERFKEKRINDMISLIAESLGLTIE